MKALHKGLLLAPLMAIIVSSSAMAQSWKWDWGVNVGFVKFTSSLDEDQTGLADNTGGSEVRFGSGGMLGSQLTFWLRPKLGLRLNGRYADRPVVGSDIDNAEFVTHVNMWGATADLMFRFKEPAAEFTGTEFLPYLALGVGAKWHNPAKDQFICNDGTNTYDCGPFVTGLPTRPRAFALGEENTIAGLIGLGADMRVARRVAIRLELSDQLFKPQFHTATFPRAAGAGNNWATSEARVSKLTHELGASIGLHFLFGLAAVPVVAIAPPPPPPPAPPPPPPTIRRESISVCVVDPTAPGGIRMQSATLVEGRDTVIVVGGSDRPFRESVGTVMVATNADWYVQGRPLTMTVGTGKTEFAVYGTPRMVESTDLAYLGTVNGYPVYADKDDVADVIGEINDLNRANAGKDLGEILNQQKDLRNALADVKVLYVPMNAAGCVFQAVQRQEEVRKGGK